MKGNSRLMFCTIFSFLLFANVSKSSALLYIVRQTCNRGTVFTPVPSTVNNICLQCVCVMAGISYCKPLIVQLSIICSAAITNVVTVTVAPTTTTTRAPTAATAAPTIPAATATTSIGINPRASTGAPSGMMGMMMSGSMMAAVTMAAATTAPVPGMGMGMAVVATTAANTAAGG